MEANTPLYQFESNVKKNSVLLSKRIDFGSPSSTQSETKEFRGNKSCFTRIIITLNQNGIFHKIEYRYLKQHYSKMLFECDLYKDEYCARLHVLEQLLEPPYKSQNLLDLPLRFLKRQISKKPYYSLKIPKPSHRFMIDYQKVPVTSGFHSREKQYEETIACISNVDRKFDEPLILECSSASLDFVLQEEMDAKNSDSINQGSNLDEKNEPKSSDILSQTNINVFSVVDEQYDHENREIGKNNDSLTLISTSSSSSSTREFYLPAASGSNDTIKIADALRETQFPKSPFIIPNAYEPPTLSNYTDFSGSVFNRPIIVKNNDCLDVPKFVRGNSLREFQNTNGEQFNANQLSVIIRSEERSIPFIKIDKFYEEFVKCLKMNERNEEPNQYPRIQPKSLNLETLDKNLFAIKSERHSEQPRNRNALPDPDEWIKEIKNNKLILDQDIIENESLKSSAPSSSVSLLLNEHQNSSQFISKKRQQGFDTPICQNYSKLRNFTGITNNKITAKPNYFNETSTMDIKRKKRCSVKELQNKNESFERAHTGRKLSDSSFLSFKNSSENNNNDLNDLNIKFKQLNGFNELATKKSVLTKLLVSSDLIVEGSGSGPEEDETNFAKRRKKRHFKIPCIKTEEPKPTKCDGKVYLQVTSGQLTDSISKLKEPAHKQLSKERPDKALINNMKQTSQDEGVYTESLMSERFNVQKLREKFNLKTSSDKHNTYASRLVQDYIGDREEIVANVTEQKPLEKRVKVQISDAKNEIVHTNEKSGETLETRQKENIENNLKCASKKNLFRNTDKLENSKITNEEPPNMRQDQLVTKSGKPAHLYDKTGLPYTDFKGRLLKNNLGIPVLNIKSYQDVVENNLSVYDTKNVKVGEQNFDPSKKPDVSTVVKVTDKVGNPASLYNNVGWPLTDEDGILLHNSNGEILVSLDSRFFPLCCKNGTPIYLKNGSTWLSQRYKYVVTTQNRATDSENSKPETHFVLNNRKTNVQQKHFFTTNQNSNINDSFTFHNNIEKNAVSTQYNSSNDHHSPNNNSSQPNYLSCRKPPKKDNLTTTDLALEILYDEMVHRNKSAKNKIETADDIYDTTSPIFDLEGNRLTDDNGYPLVNMYGEPLLLFDKNGRAISDAYGGPIFNSLGEQLLSSSVCAENKLLESYPNETYLPPERPYCEQIDETNVSYLSPDIQQSSGLISDEFENSLYFYKESEPLLKLIEKNDIRAWDIHKEVPSSVQSIYSLVGHNYKSMPSPNSAKGDLHIKSQQQYYSGKNKYSRPTYTQYSYPLQSRRSNSSRQLQAQQQYYGNYPQSVVSKNYPYYYDIKNDNENNYASNNVQYLPGNTRNIRVISMSPSSSYKTYNHTENNQYY